MKSDSSKPDHDWFLSLFVGREEQNGLVNLICQRQVRGRFCEHFHSWNNRTNIQYSGVLFECFVFGCFICSVGIFSNYMGGHWVCRVLCIYVLEQSAKCHIDVCLWGDVEKVSIITALNFQSGHHIIWFRDLEF